MQYAEQCLAELIGLPLSGATGLGGASLQPIAAAAKCVARTSHGVSNGAGGGSKRCFLGAVCKDQASWAST